MKVHDTDPDELAPAPRSRPYAAPGADPLARRVADRAVDVAERAVAAADALERRVAAVEVETRELRRDQAEMSHILGRPPVPATGETGSGMAAAVAELVESDRERRRSREAWLTWWRRLGLVVGGLAATGGLIRLLFDVARR